MEGYDMKIYINDSMIVCRVGPCIFSDDLEISSSFRLPDNCTVFQKEIYAIYQGLQLLIENSFSSRQHRNYFRQSSSTSVTKILLYYFLTRKKIQEELNWIVQLFKFESLTELVHPIELYQSERRTKMP